MQKTIAKAWEMLGKELPELRREAEKAALEPETERKQQSRTLPSSRASVRPSLRR